MSRQPRRYPRLREFGVAALPLALVAALPCSAQSLRVDYVLGASVLHSDNVNLSDATPQSETVVSPEVNFEASQSSSSTSFRARGRIQYLSYVEDTFDDETRGEFAGQFTWMLLPQRLSLVVEDYLGQQPVDFTSGYSPSNQQQINVFTAGPSLFMRFGDAMRGQVDLRYSDTYAEETRDFNGNRYLAAGRLFRDLGTDQWISMNIEASQVRFDLDAANADYDRYDAFIRYRRESTRLDLDASLGYTRLDQNSAAGEESSPLARLQLDWQASPRSVISATAAYQFADTASDLISDSNRLDDLVIDDITTPTGLVGPAVYRQRRYELGYRFTEDLWNFQVRPYTERVDYNDLQLSGWTTRGAYLDLQYELRPRLNLGMSVVREDRDYVDIAREDRDTLASIELSYEFSSHLSGSLGWQRRDRESNIPGQDYRENVATISVAYRR